MPNSAHRCDAGHLELPTSYLPCTVTDFPVRYMGVPLSVTTLSRVAWQCLIDGMADQLLMGKGGFTHKSSHLALIKSTLAAMPVHTTISLELRAWVRKAMLKIMRTFMWSGMEAV
jgi:hypothetical protein